MKKVLFILLICTLLISSMAFAKEFPDVASTHWAHQYISELSDQGVINGYEDGTFRPDKKVTRAEFMKLVVECLDKGIFEEAEKMLSNAELPNWYDKYFIYGSLAGISPFSYSYGEPNVETTREEMVDVLYAYGKNYGLFNNIKLNYQQLSEKSIIEVAYELKYIKKKMTDKEFEKQYSKFTDEQKRKINEKIEESKVYSSDFVDFEVAKQFDDLKELDYDKLLEIEYLVKSKLLNGYEDKTFKLENSLTRAETATIIYRLKNMKGN